MVISVDAYREELLEVELQMATMRCEELRHNLQVCSTSPHTRTDVVEHRVGLEPLTGCKGLNLFLDTL